MKNRSWEIIVAGLFLLLVAIIITSKADDNKHSHDEERYSARATAKATPSERSKTSTRSVTVIDVEELAKMEELKELEELKSLDGLEKLKNLAALIPEEAKQEMMNELDAALKELEDDSFSINIDLAEGLLMLKKEYKVTPGEWSNVSPGVYAFTEEFDATGLDDLSVQLTSGSIVLVGSDNTKASITVKASGDIATKESLKETVSVSTKKNGSSAELRVVNTKSNDSNIQVQTTIYIPSSMDVTSFTSGGHIEATNFQGDIECKTSGGHITLKDLSGDITAFTEGGHIKLSDSRGDASLKSLGGHLSAVNFEGDLEMSTSGGNVSGKDLSGSTNAFSSGGNIKLSFLRIGGDIQARNGAGQIDLFLPADVNVDLNVNGTKVEIDEAFPFNGSKKKSQIIGKIGKGGVEVVAKTGYGTVSINKNE
ncbi:MAG: hypothetical protein JJ892_12785 [Balneola sp.]|nr:hypothetical protein [Balneola sp.]MBO6651716.1 hypothetical protein [Balneola sp.]MBO6712846.1 hypothetical protein [Balneola sp.]MBO6801145.1 hypothetical protein [Balneola sp.]MBO6871337.1 hypothetical protein [Balneola sp.]